MGLRTPPFSPQVGSTVTVTHSSIWLVKFTCPSGVVLYSLPWLLTKRHCSFSESSGLADNRGPPKSNSASV